MKILWLTTFEAGTFGHSELFGLTTSLIKKGHEVTIVGASRENPRKEGPILYMKKSFNKQTLFKLKLALCLPRLVSSIKPDFIVVEWQSAFIPAILLFFIKLGLYRNNLIHDVRTIPVNDFEPRRVQLFRTCLNFSKRHYLGITTITRELKRKLCLEYDIRSEKVGIWSSGVDTDLFYPRNGLLKKKELGLDGKFMIFYHGSLGYRRGIVEVVRALALLRYRYRDICFFILGSGTELDNIHKIIEDKKLDNVYIQRPVSYYEVPEYIAMADICIVPLADIEPWRVSSPLKLMEYLAMGKPVILTDIVAHREIIKKEKEALFIPDVDPRTLATAIEKAYLERGELWKFAELGLRNVQENWSWDIQAEKFLRHLQYLQLFY